MSGKADGKQSAHRCAIGLYLNREVLRPLAGLPSPSCSGYPQALLWQPVIGVAVRTGSANDRVQRTRHKVCAGTSGYRAAVVSCVQLLLRFRINRFHLVLPKKGISTRTRQLYNILAPHQSFALPNNTKKGPASEAGCLGLGSILAGLRITVPVTVNFC